MRHVVAAMLALFAAPALAHDFWLDGSRVDPLTKAMCCGENDTKQVPRELVEQTRAGLRFRDTGETIPWARVQPSPDGAYWRSTWGGETKCVFAPVAGF